MPSSGDQGAVEDDRTRCHHAVGALTLSHDGCRWSLARRGEVLAEGNMAEIKEALRARRDALRARRENRVEPRERPPAPGPEPGRGPALPEGPGDVGAYREFMDRRWREEDRRFKIGAWDASSLPRKGQLCTWESGLGLDPSTGAVVEGPAKVVPLTRRVNEGRRPDPERPFYVAVRPSIKAGHYEVLGGSRNPALVEARLVEAEKADRNAYRESLVELIDLFERRRPEDGDSIEGLKEELRRQGPFEAVRGLDGTVAAPRPERVPRRGPAPAPRPRAEASAPPEPSPSPLRAIAEAYRRTAPRPAAEPPPRPLPGPSGPDDKRSHRPVVRVERTYEDRAVFSVVACPDDEGDANARAARAPKDLAVWPHGFRERLEFGQKLVARADEPGLKPVVARARWRQEVHGEFARVAVWGLGQREPQINDVVKVLPVTGETDGAPRDDRVVPLGHDPERDRHAYREPTHKTYAVLTRDPRVPGAWRIAALTTDRAEAVARKRAVEVPAQERAKVHDPKRWRTMTMTM